MISRKIEETVKISVMKLMLNCYLNLKDGKLQVSELQRLYSPSGKMICTNPNNTDSENVKTLVHELAHAILTQKAKFS